MSVDTTLVSWNLECDATKLALSKVADWNTVEHSVCENHLRNITIRIKTEEHDVKRTRCKDILSLSPLFCEVLESFMKYAGSPAFRNKKETRGRGPPARINAAVTSHLILMLSHFSDNPVIDCSFSADWQNSSSTFNQI